MDKITYIKLVDEINLIVYTLRPFQNISAVKIYEILTGFCNPVNYNGLTLTPVDSKMRVDI